jgi:hypothetical protein
MRERPKPSDILDVYIDESSQNNHRFLVLGCVVLTSTDATPLGDLIMRARLPDLPEKEAKWSKVSRGKLVAYKRIVDVDRVSTQ